MSLLKADVVRRGASLRVCLPALSAKARPTLLVVLSLLLCATVAPHAGVTVAQTTSRQTERRQTTGGQTTPPQRRKRDRRRRRGGTQGHVAPQPPPTPKYPELYRVRLLLVDDQGSTVDEAEISSSLGGESMTVKAGGLYVIPAATVPQDRWLTIIAEKRSAFIKGSARTQLTTDANPSLTITLEENKTASISGIVLNEAGGVVKGAKVSVAGYPGEEVVTDSSGNFSLRAHAAKNKMIRLHVSADGFESINGWYMAGDGPHELRLRRTSP